MNLIERIAKLKERDNGSPADMTNRDYEIMLSAMSMIRAGDAEILADWLYQIEEEYGEDGTDSKDQPITKLLRRYRAMAQRMEAEG